jgi:hypothetical protein
MYMAVALLVWVAWIIKKYEVRSRKYENTPNAYLAIMSLRSYRRDFFYLYKILSGVEGPFNTPLVNNLFSKPSITV